MTPEPDDNWDACLAELVRHAVRMLRPQTRSVVDPEDVVASALASYFAVRDTNTATSPDENFLAFLLNGVRRHCEKWNMRTRRHPSISYHATDQARELAQEPTAPLSLEDQTRAFDEVVEFIARDLLDNEKEVFLMLIEGLTVSDISKRVGCVERTVRRCRKKIVERVQSLQAPS
ncbi:MAG TPA: ECF-type sigma factor [Gemmataceae bacterium]|nr:ECF-type sigma factor [Gemmataceae bacterium]